MPFSVLARFSEPANANDRFWCSARFWGAEEDAGGRFLVPALAGGRIAFFGTDVCDSYADGRIGFFGVDFFDSCADGRRSFFAIGRIDDLKCA